MWTPAGPPERFLLEMNLSNLDTSLFWTVDTFFWSRPWWRTSLKWTAAWFPGIFGTVSRVRDENQE